MTSSVVVTRSAADRIPGSAGVLTGLLFAFFNRTKLGVAMQASSQNQLAAEVRKGSLLLELADGFGHRGIRIE